MRSCGAEACLSREKHKNAAHGDSTCLPTAIRNMTEGLGAAATLVCTSADSAYVNGLDMLRFNGTLVVVSVQEGAEYAIFNASPNAFLFTQKSIVGSSVGNYRESAEVMDLSQRGVIRPRVDLEKLENLQAEFERMERGQLEGKVVLEIE